MDREQVLFGKEEDTLRWFETFLDTTSGSFKTSVELFRKYYQKCVNDLIHLQFDGEKDRILYADLGEKKEASPDYECHYINQQDIDQCRNNHYHTNVVSALRENEFLRQAVLEYQLLTKEELDILMNLPEERVQSLTTEELYLLMKDPNYLNLSGDERERLLRHTRLSKDQENEIIFPFLKIHRLNNLQIKYAHTARVVYLANYELDSLHIDSPFIRSIALTSALFHDVGRFYQGAFYNHFGDQAMKAIEANKGHAEAGYYYSLLDMISLNTLGVDQSEDLIIHAIAALIVNNHQKSNSENKDFDHAEQDLSFSPNLEGRLFRFIVDAYLKAKPFEGGVHARFGNSIPHQQKYMKQAMDSIVEMMKKVLQQYISNPEELEQITSNIGSFLEGGLSSAFFLTKEEEEILNQYSLPKEIEILRREDPNHEVRIVRTPELNRWLNEQKRKIFCESNHLDYAHFDSLLSRAQMDLAKFVQFDIVSAIEEMFHEGKDLDPEIRKIIDFCLNIVTDADKIDILTQRVNKRWDNWNPKRIRTKAREGESFLQVLEKVYLIPLNRNSAGEVIFDDQLKRIVLENMQGNTVFARKISMIADLSKDELSPNELTHLMRFLNGDYSQLMVTNKFGTNEAGKPVFTRTLLNLVLEMKRKSEPFREVMDAYPIEVNENSVGMVIPDDLFQILQKYNIELRNYNNNYISVSYEEMSRVYPNDQMRSMIELGIVLPKDLREKVFLLDQDRGEKKFPMGQSASSDPHFQWNNAFPAIWWHIDQFIMTNMRSQKSFQFLIDTQMLDRLRETYQSSECPPEFSDFIDEIIEYGKLFLEVAVKTSMKDGQLQFDSSGDTIDLMDEHVMIQIRDEVAKRWEERKKKGELDSLFATEETVKEREILEDASQK